jgi:RHH-type rel operon transcriptional repressor/antitoxin RelB
MRSTTFTVRVNAAAKKRLGRLAKSTGRSRSFLAAEAINAYLDVNEWQVAGIKRAIASLDRGEAVPHDQVKEWSRLGAAVGSGRRGERIGAAPICSASCLQLTVNSTLLTI